MLFICPSDLQFTVHAKAEVQTKLYIFVTFSSDSTILAELENDITASIKYVPSDVQDPSLISKSFSVRNLSVLFLCKLDGLEVHVMFLFRVRKHCWLIFFHTHCCTHNNGTYWYMAAFYITVAFCSSFTYGVCATFDFLTTVCIVGSTATRRLVVNMVVSRWSFPTVKAFTE